MNLQQLKQKALALKDKTVNAGKEAIDYSASKLSESKLTLKTKEDLEAFIQRSSFVFKVSFDSESLLAL